jgi:diguanylate cyclase (GGDEF)-like protein
MPKGTGQTPKTSGGIGARILILSEDQAEASALGRMLHSLLDDATGLTVARSLDEARTLLQAHERDCLVLATSEAMGYDTIPSVLQHEDLVHRLPVVVVGDGPAWQDGKHALSLGADDYVARDELDGQRLLSSVLLAIERGRRRAVEPPIRDALTGLPNRLLFMDRLRLAFARRERSSADVLVMFIDVDSFKEINDLLGHAAGDTVLRTVAQRLRTSFRVSDTVARLGGDEFAVMCEGPELRSLLPKLEAKVAEVFRQPIPIEGEDLAVLASTGVVFAEDDERDADLLLRRADAAMYESKRRAERRSGGNGHSIDDLRV